MSFLSPIKSMLFYTGSISIAASFTGDKDVTITTVEPTKASIIPAGGTNVTSTGVYSPSIAFTTGSVKWDYTHIPSNTVVRFKNVVNTDTSNTRTLTYAFWVQEFR